MHPLAQALAQARHFVGATAPNPPVGAAAVDSDGRVLGAAAHERAGAEHAEAKLLRELGERGLLDRVSELHVTLEPCNHHGRTPPCAEAILAAGVRRVVYGARDPNPRVAGGGGERLRAAGADARLCDDPGLRAQCEELIRPFAHWASTGLPWVTVKTAHLAGGAMTMIPPPGQKTFTSPSSLRRAHELRRRADAILTGSGTVLADLPELTVRHVPDHALVAQGLKPRALVVLDRRRRAPPEWLARARELGFDVLVRGELEDAIRELGQRGNLEILVEAGPSLTRSVLDLGLWNQHVLITREAPPGTEDRVEIRTNVHWHRTESRNPSQS